MKSKLLLLFLSIVTLATAKTATIKGHINGKLPETLYYTAPVNGAFGFAMCYTATVDAKGNFEIKTDTYGVTFIDVYYNYQPAGCIVILCGGAYSLTITEKEGKVTHLLTGTDAEMQKRYSALVNNREAHFFDLAQQAFEIEEPGAFTDFFDSKLQADLKALDTNNPKIIPAAASVPLVRERQSFYAAAKSYALILKHLKAEREPTPPNLQPFDAIWTNLYSKEIAGINQSPWCSYYLDGYKNYVIYKSVGFNGKDIVRAPDALSDIKRATGLLPKQFHEVFIAQQLYNYTFGNRKDKGAIMLFNFLKEQYPNSGFIKYFEPKVAPVVNFFAATDNLPQGAAFVDNYDQINTFEDLVKKFPGKKLYFDVWATWCGPCREEFKYKDELYKLLAANDITVVYISLDKDDKDETWKKMIGHYGLQGYHIRTNQKLGLNLNTLFNSDGNVNSVTTAIPWYILVNNTGTITALHATPPSEMDKLEQQVKKL
ncbi:MAG: TlpA disulfide reductase family protein [Bacteroidota bacterium]